MEQELRKYLILPYDIKTCRLWGEIRAKCSKSGQPISPQDAWIAATARQGDAEAFVIRLN
jgi:tRNA(fMet)-specific endonuclease VapC